MDISSGIANAATNMKAAQIQNQIDIAVLKNAMDSSEEIANQLIQALMSVNVGSARPAKLDMSV